MQRFRRYFVKIITTNSDAWTLECSFPTRSPSYATCFEEEIVKKDKPGLSRATMLTYSASRISSRATPKHSLTCSQLHLGIHRLFCTKLFDAFLYSGNVFLGNGSPFDV